MLYIAQLMKPMDEAIVENLSTLANLVLTYGSNLMIADGLERLPISLAVLILVLLTARNVNRKRGGFLKSFRARDPFTDSGRLFESQRSP
ncbi:MAG: hypothetical protein ACREX3_25780, partial [Gammaproteobacteria bacterium]